MKHPILKAATGLLGLLLLVVSCSKSSDESPTDPCTGVTINVSATVTNTTGAGLSNGSLVVSATGGAGFTFSLNGGAFGNATTFSNLAAGNYTITAKSSAGCTGTGNFTITTGDACAGKTIVVSGVTTASDKCSNTGTVTITATGGSGFTYSLNNGTYQSGAQFSNVAPGSHTILARDADGCVKSATVTVTTATAGTNFSAVKNLIQTNCISCHNNSNQNGSVSFADDCGIVSRKDRIKARAVDGNPSFMPQGGQLSQADKDKITAWINAGGKYTD